MTKSTAQPQQPSQSLLVKLGLLGPEHAVDMEHACPQQVGDEQAREDPAVQLDVAVPRDEAPLDETQPVELPVLQRPSEDRLSNWNVSGSRKNQTSIANSMRRCACFQLVSLLGSKKIKSVRRLC